jgi:Flp pilus assembly protein CpaB
LKRSNRLVLLIGIFLALVVFALIAFTYRPSGGANASPTPPTTATVVVARSDISLGTTITGTMVTTKEIPIAEVPPDSYGDTSLVIGKVARLPVTSGQLIDSAILNSNGSVDDIEVPAGFVAMALQVDQVTGVGTVIKPGDFVDVISGFTAPDKVPLVVPGVTDEENTFAYTKVEDELYNHTTVKVLSQGLQVLGTLLPPPPEQDTQASPAPSSDPATTLNGQQQIVILAVPMQEAEVIKFSQMDGTISLVLRSSEDCTTEPADGEPYCPVIATTGITLRRLVDDRGVLPPQVVQVIEPTPYPGTEIRTPRP